MRNALKVPLSPSSSGLGTRKPKALELSRVAQQDSSERIDGLVDFGLLGIIDMFEPRL